MEELIAEGSRDLDILGTMTRDNPGQQDRLAALRPLLDERIAIVRDGIDLPDWEDLDQATRGVQRAHQGRGSDLAKLTAASFDTLQNEEQRLLEDRERRTLAVAESTESTLLYGGAIGILMVGLIYGSHVHESRARARVQHDLARTNTLFNAVLDVTTDVIAVKDTLGRYLLINAAGCRNLGHPAAEIVGQTDAAFLTGGTAESVMAADRELLRSGETRTFEQVASVGDRSWTFHSTKGPFRSPTGELLGIIVVSRDITEKTNGGSPS